MAEDGTPGPHTGCENQSLSTWAGMYLQWKLLEQFRVDFLVRLVRDWMPCGSKDNPDAPDQVL